MMKFPETNLEWAKEAYDALCLAHIYYKEEYPTPTDKQKLELFSYAVPLAIKNRNIKNEDIIKAAHEYVYDKLSHDINPLLPGEVVHYSIRFLNAYLDAQVVFNVLPEEKVGEIMKTLDTHYVIDIPV